MKAIKLLIHQESANYRIPISHGFRESYPLPPYSTVIGMVHALCGFTEYHPMKVSVQGRYDSTTSDFFTRYEFKNGMKFDSGRHQLKVGDFGVSRGIGYTQLLINIDLMLHIIPDNQDEITEIFEKLSHPLEFPSLGRREDIAKFESVSIVEINEEELEEGIQNAEFEKRKSWAAYIPIKLINDKAVDIEATSSSSLYSGTEYELNKEYSLVEVGRGKSKRFERRWEKEQVLYTSQYTLDEENNFFKDSDGDFIFPA